MASDARTVLNAIVTKLQTANGAGVYHNDLSATNRVVIGRPTEPGTVPQVFVFHAGMRSEQQPGREYLGAYRRVLTVGIVGFVAGTTDSSSDALLAACDLYDDICSAIENDRGLGITSGTSTGQIPGGIIDVMLQGEAIEGSELDMPAEVGLVVASCEVAWRVTRGA